STPQQAIHQYRREAIKAAFMPTLNQMMLIGMVSIPFFTSGQLLAGISPLEAVSYEILIIFMVAIVNLVTTIFLTKGLYQQFFNHAMQLIR
ncbi:MAG: ABC transporter permease, partial [Sphaerospermopsis sp. SIO1G2]|nr:ABC transporter permease [Sphaerospermopsis sp. SIO1G2]